MATMDPDRTRRRQIFAALTPSFGRILPATFVRNPKISGVERIHPLIEGIYKPAWSNYALSIASMIQSQYNDQMHYHPDGTWWMHYSPKSGSMDLAMNASVVRCMTDREPRQPFPENLRLLRMPGEYLWRRVIENDDDELQWWGAIMLVPIVVGAIKGSSSGFMLPTVTLGWDCFAAQLPEAVNRIGVSPGQKAMRPWRQPS